MIHALARATLLVLILLSGAPVSGNGGSDSIHNQLPDATLVGEARLKVLFWDVFDARLYAADGQLDRDRPFALALTYLRDFKGRRIVETTLEEMSRQGALSSAERTRWEKQLSSLIPDVADGTTITGVRDDNGHTLFYRDGEALGRIEDEAFTRAFFDIWLGEKASRPELRQALLGPRRS